MKIELFRLALTCICFVACLSYWSILWRRFCLFLSFGAELVFIFEMLTSKLFYPRLTRKVTSHRGTSWGGRGVKLMDPIGFCGVKIFRKDFNFSKNLWCALQDKVHCLGSDAAGSLRRSPRSSPSWIFSKTRNYQKTAKSETFWRFINYI